jgi:predicted DNA-binding protein
MATRTTAVTVRLGKNLVAQLQERAQAEEKTCAEIIRQALEHEFDTSEQLAMLDDIRGNILARLESLERLVVAEINSLVAGDAESGGAK